MSISRYTTSAAIFCTILLLPVSAPAAASKEMQDLQRDVAQLSDQLKDLQKSLDSRVGALQGLVQQALDTSNKTNTSVNNMNVGMMQTIQTALKGLSEQLNSVTGLSLKISSVSEDVSNLQSSVKDLQVTVNRQQAMLSEILNQVKLIQAPPVAPPPVDSGTPPPPTGQALFNGAAHDEDAGNLDLALKGFTEFLRLYPNDPSAIRAQYNIGNIYYSQSKPSEALKALDAAIEQYSEDPITTPSAYYMKGMALKQLKETKDAIAAFRKVVHDFPGAPEAGQAATQLRTLGATVPAAGRGRK